MCDCGVSNTLDTSTGVGFIDKYKSSGGMLIQLDISIHSSDSSSWVVSTGKKLFVIADCGVKHSSVIPLRMDSPLVDGTVSNNFLINVLKHFSSKLRIVNVIPVFFL